MRMTRLMGGCLFLTLSFSSRFTNGFGLPCLSSSTSCAAMQNIISRSTRSALIVSGGTQTHSSSSSSTTLFMSPQRTRGLESRRESATPTEGDMTLYLKAGPDGKSVGDCPFGHFVRLVLEEKKLKYEIKPSVQETKPQWLIDHYEGKMPALRHGKECYVESDVIAEYIDFFFQDPPLQLTKDKVAITIAAEEAVKGFFPSVAKYLKNTNDENDPELLSNLQSSLTKLETHFKDNPGYEYLCGSQLTLLDCSLLPKLYHLIVGVEGYKNSKPVILGSDDYPLITAYYNRLVERPSFQSTIYPKEVILWGWGNARK